jgi:hypothetical protein
MVWAAWRMRSSTSAAVRASRTSSSADWSRATVRVSFRENQWRGLADHRTVATPAWQLRPRGPATYTTRWDATRPDHQTISLDASRAV